MSCKTQYSNNLRLVIWLLYLIGVPVRLIGGDSYNEGRVEVYYNGEWGTVCDDGWDNTDAGVVCRQLGFGSSGTAIGSAGFGQGSGSILLDGVTCTGSESTLASCGHLGVGITTSCDHSKDAGIECSGEQGLYMQLYHDCHIICEQKSAKFTLNNTFRNVFTLHKPSLCLLLATCD